MLKVENRKSVASRKIRSARIVLTTGSRSNTGVATRVQVQTAVLGRAEIDNEPREGIVILSKEANKEVRDRPTSAKAGTNMLLTKRGKISLERADESRFAERIRANNERLQRGYSSATLKEV